jgi:hypothetical protein
VPTRVGILNHVGSRPRRWAGIAAAHGLIWVLIVVSLVVSGVVIWPGQLHARPAAHAARNTSDFPGASIVEQLQAAIRDCAADPCDIYIPAGSYDASPIATWKSRDTTGASVGVAIPSNVEIRGAGMGRTIIRVARSAADPSGTLFANAGASNRNIRLREMSINWTDSNPKVDWVSIFICHACDQLELDHLNLEGNPNKLVNLLDCTATNIHDNKFLLHSTSYAHGDSALSVSRFDPNAAVAGAAGVVRDNYFTQTGDYRIFSMVVISQSGLYVHSNVFEAHLPLPGYATGIESGQDNLARLPENVNISGNVFHGASIAYGGLNNSEISGNFFDHGDIYVALQSGTISSLSGLTVADNELHFGSISIRGLTLTLTGRLIITRNRVFDGGIGAGGFSTVHDTEVSYNSVRNSSNMYGIECDACSLIRGNVVREIGQNAPGDVHAGYLIGGMVEDVSDNIYIDEQHEYDVGTICSVANPSSTICLSSGSSRWVRLQGGEWGFGWTNRMLLIDQNKLPIRAFVNASLLELEENTALQAGTHYHLFRTTFNAFELNGAVIERFANNLVVAPGGFRRAAVQEDGTVRILSLSGNAFHPYSCYGKCAVDYRATVNAPEQAPR